MKKTSETLTTKRFDRYMKGKTFCRDTIIPAMKKAAALHDHQALEKHSDRIQNCGRFLSVARCQACDTGHFLGFDRCKSKWCVPCSAVKTKIWIAKLAPVILESIKEGKAVSLLTLTLKDHDLGQLLLMVDRLMNAWQIITHGRGNRAKWKKKIFGGIRNMEVKIGQESGIWHAHFHCILIHIPERFYEWIKDVWERATAKTMGTDAKVGSIDIRSIKTPNGCLKGIIEAVKYPVKPEASLWDSPEKVIEAFEVLHGRKQAHTFGSLRKVAAEVEKENEVDEKRLDIFICQACGCTEAVLEKELASNFSVSSGKLADVVRER